MTPALKLQGRLFCAVSLVLVVAMLAGARTDPRHELLAVGVLILLLGVPHGALDIVVARGLFGAVGFKTWTVFLLLYVGLTVLVVCLWIMEPALFLCAFFVVSALHFGGDMALGVSRLKRLLYGGTVIVLPVLWHGDELHRLLGLVAGPASADFILPMLSQLALPWLCATLFFCLMTVKQWPLAAAEWIALTALAVTAPPLLAFTVYFCVMHSPRHILKTVSSLQGAEARKALSMAVWPTVVVFLAAALVGTLASGIPLETRLLQLIFVGLAALTLPHMALLEWARRASLPPTSVSHSP